MTVSNVKIVQCSAVQCSAVQCSVRYFVEIHELQTELSVFEARGVANFGTQCILYNISTLTYLLIL